MRSPWNVTCVIVYFLHSEYPISKCHVTIAERSYAMKRQDVECALLDYGTKRGVLTFDELNDAFPAEYFPLNELERFLRVLDKLGVKVVERAERRRNRQKQAA